MSTLSALIADMEDAMLNDIPEAARICRVYLATEGCYDFLYHDEPAVWLVRWNLASCEARSGRPDKAMEQLLALEGTRFDNADFRRALSLNADFESLRHRRDFCALVRGA